MGGFTGLDVVVLIAYVGGVAAFGLLLGRRQRDARDYFLASRGVPWWAICFSIVATETSALTFISIPATSYQTDFWFLQLALGYLIGRLVIAAVLLPGYFRGELSTAYALLEQRFGLGARRFASSIFLVTRGLADSIRVFAAAIPIALITGWPYWQAILLAGLVTLAYTYYGGLRAVIWVDVVQMFLYVFGGLAALYLLIQWVPGGWGGIVEAAAADQKLRLFRLDGGFGDAHWLFTGLIGGAFLSMASHGVDHLIVQRLLASPSLGDARKALVGSGFLVFVQFALFLAVGVGLYAFYQGQVFDPADEVFPSFIIGHLPAGLAGLLIAGVLAAMMSTVSSSLNSLASATTHDLYAPLARRGDNPRHLLRMGRVFTLVWFAIIIGGAILFQFAAAGTPIVVLALQIASFTYGGLLGGFFLALLWRRADQRDAVTGMAVAIAVMAALWWIQFAGVTPRLVDTLWFALLGSALTVAVGVTSSLMRGGRGPEAPEPVAAGAGGTSAASLGDPDPPATRG